MFLIIRLICVGLLYSGLKCTEMFRYLASLMESVEIQKDTINTFLEPDHR